MNQIRWGTVLALLILIPIIGRAQVSQVHLGWSENNVHETMTVMWYSPVKACQIVYYDIDSGTVPADYQYNLSGEPSKIEPMKDIEGTLLSPQPKPFDGYYYTAPLVDLLPGQTYSFRIHDEYTGTLTREWCFRTIDYGETIEFAFAGDSQRPHEINGVDFAQLIGRPDSPANWPYMRNFITQKAAGLEPDFFLGLGDFVSRGNNQEQWHNWFDAWQDYAVTDAGRMIPMVPVIGNHEMGGYTSVEPTSYEWFMGLFAIPHPPQAPPGVPCYSLDFPNLHLTVLAATSGQIMDNAMLAAYEAEMQVPWLAGDLTSAVAQSAKWQFVAFHYNYLGCFLACTGYGSDEYMGVWTQLLQDWGVDTILMGHTHNYTRSWPVCLDLPPNQCSGGSLGYTKTPYSEDGVTYITHGGWGGVSSLIVDGEACQLRDWIAAAASHPSLGYVRLDDVTCHFLIEDTAGGDPLDEFTLPYAPDYNDYLEYTEMVP